MPDEHFAVSAHQPQRALSHWCLLPVKNSILLLAKLTLRLTLRLAQLLQKLTTMRRKKMMMMMMMMQVQRHPP